MGNRKLFSPQIKTQQLVSTICYKKSIGPKKNFVFNIFARPYFGTKIFIDTSTVKKGLKVISTLVLRGESYVFSFNR